MKVPPAPPANRPRKGSTATVPPAGKESPAPVMGSVRASQPTLRADQVVVPPGADPVISTMMPPRAAHVPDTEAPAVAIFSGPGAAGSWRSLIEEVRKEKIGIGTMLGETSFHGVRGNNVRISCPDDFHADILKRNRHYISALAERMYGAKIQIDTILAENRSDDAPPPADTREGRPSSGGVSGKNLRDHPLVQALITEFGAEEIR